MQKTAFFLALALTTTAAAADPSMLPAMPAAPQPPGMAAPLPATLASRVCVYGPYYYTQGARISVNGSHFICAPERPTTLFNNRDGNDKPVLLVWRAPNSSDD